MSQVSIDKKAAARKAAAKHSTNLALATVEYASLTKSLDLVATESGRQSLQDEMLSMLPPYRHPTYNKLTEYMIFFDPNCINITGSIYQEPEFIEELKKEGVKDALLTAIKKYVTESEPRIIDLAQCKNELAKLRTKLLNAKRIYDENINERPETRNSRVVRNLGFSTGFAPARVDGEKVYFDYVTLVRKKGFTRNEAVEAIRKEYSLNSFNATLKFLYQRRKSILEKWKTQHPSLYPEIKSRLKGLIPRKSQ